MAGRGTKNRWKVHDAPRGPNELAVWDDGKPKRDPDLDLKERLRKQAMREKNVASDLARKATNADIARMHAEIGRMEDELKAAQHMYQSGGRQSAQERATKIEARLRSARREVQHVERSARLQESARGMALLQLNCKKEPEVLTMSASIQKDVAEAVDAAAVARSKQVIGEQWRDKEKELAHKQAVEALPVKLTDEQYTEYRSHFARFDADSGGTIDAGELGPLMRSLGENPTPEELYIICEEMDHDGSGDVCFAEFVLAIAMRRGLVTKPIPTWCPPKALTAGSTHDSDTSVESGSDVTALVNKKSADMPRVPVYRVPPAIANAAALEGQMDATAAVRNQEELSARAARIAARVAQHAGVSSFDKR